MPHRLIDQYPITTAGALAPSTRNAPAYLASSSCSPTPNWQSRPQSESAQARAGLSVTNPRRIKQRLASSNTCRSNHHVRDGSSRKAHRCALGHHIGRRCPRSATRRRIYAHHLIPLIGTWNRQHRPVSDTSEPRRSVLTLHRAVRCSLDETS
jgi:hypothetical protein